MRYRFLWDRYCGVHKQCRQVEALVSEGAGDSVVVSTASVSSSLSSQLMIHTHAPATSTVAMTRAAHWVANRPTSLASITSSTTMPIDRIIQAAKRGWRIIHFTGGMFWS